MKKGILGLAVLLVFAALLMAKSFIGTTSAAAPKVLLVASAYKAEAVIQTYNSNTTTVNATYGLIDAVSVATATGAWKVTLTANTTSPVNNLIGFTMGASNGSGIGAVEGVEFTNGVVVDGNGSTLSVSLRGK